MWLPIAVGAGALGLGALSLLLFSSRSHRQYTHGLIIGDSMLATPIMTSALSQLTGIPWDNVAVSGRGSTDIYRQLQSNFRPGVHDIVLASAGANDGARDITTTQNNILRIARDVDAGGADLVLFTEPPLRGYASFRSRPQAIIRSESSRDWVRSGGSGARFILDLHRIIGDGRGVLRSEYDGGDHLHPNRDGRVAMAQEVARAIL